MREYQNMTMTLKILVIDSVQDTLDEISNILADNFELVPFLTPQEAIFNIDKIAPDFIVLGNELSGGDGANLCKEIKKSKIHQNVPIVIISEQYSPSFIQKCYQAGAYDTIEKVLLADLLLLKLKSFQQQRHENFEMKQQFQQAQNLALDAMKSNSRLGQVMVFIEHSYGVNQIETLAQRLFHQLESLSLTGYLWTCINKKENFFGHDGNVPAKEEALLSVETNENRFVDVKSNTVVLFPHIRLLITNMPINDENEYGQIKDLLPVIMGAMNAKIEAIEEQTIMTEQAQKLTDSFLNIKETMVTLAAGLNHNNKVCITLLEKMYVELQASLPGLALEFTQEEFILNLAQNTVEKLTDKLNNTDETNKKLAQILLTMQKLVNEQNTVIEQIKQDLVSSHADVEEDYEDIELF